MAGERLAMILCQALLVAQAGAIKGTVWDLTGVTVPGVRVVLMHGTKAIAEQKTDAQGGYKFAQVPPGTYRVLATAADGRSEDQGVNVAAGHTGSADIFLPMFGERIEIIGGPPPAPPPPRNPHSRTSLTREDIRELPRGEAASVNEIVATQAGLLPDSWGTIKARAHFGNVGVRVDGVPVPDSLAGEVGELIPATFLDEIQLGLGGSAADEGERNAGELGLVVHRPGSELEGRASLSGGADQLLWPSLLAGRSVGNVSIVAGASAKTSERAFDIHSSDSLPHDRGVEERGLFRLEWQNETDRLALLAVAGHEDKQVPNNVSQEMSPDAFGNAPAPFTPQNTDARLGRQDLLVLASYRRERATGVTASLAWRHASGSFFADATHALGPLQAGCMDSCATASDIDRTVDRLTGFFEVATSQKLKLGAQLEQTFSRGSFAQYKRSDALAGPDPALTLRGAQGARSTGAAIFAAGELIFGRLRIDAGLRLEAFGVSVDAAAAPPVSFDAGPRLGASFAFSDDFVMHANGGLFWSPPSAFEPWVAAGAQGVAGPASPGYDLRPETMRTAELGLSWRALESLSLTVTGWGRLTSNQLDDNEGGITSLLLPYQYAYRRGWGAGVDISASYRPIARLRLFATALLEHAVGQSIVEGGYLFSPGDRSDDRWQILDHVQTLTANAGAAFKDRGTQAIVLASYGSGLRTGPRNNGHVPGHVRVDLGLSHQLLDVPGRPSLGIDVINLFDARYAIRLANEKDPSHWGPARSALFHLGASF